MFENAPSIFSSTNFIWMVGSVRCNQKRRKLSEFGLTKNNL
eukprot:UN13317